MASTITTLTGEHLEPAFELATRVFVQGSTLHRALDITLEEYKTYLRPSFEDMISEKLSVVSVDEKTGRVIGCLIATDFSQHLHPTIEFNSKFAPLSALTVELCRQYLEKRSINAGEAVLIDMGVVHPEATGKNIYQKMRDAAQKIAHKAGFRCVIGELSSTSTQHVILNKFGHQKLAEVQFSQFEFAGNYPFQSITEPKSIILAEGML